MRDFFNNLKTEFITQLNFVFTAILLWLSQQQNAPIDPLLVYLPDSVHGIAKIVGPILVGVVVQAAIVALKKRTETNTIDKIVTQQSGA